jgi:L,D-transpeptidase YcbB
MILLGIVGCRNLNVGSSSQVDYLGDITELPKIPYMPRSVADTVYHGLNDRSAVVEFYNLRKHELIWFRKGHATPLSDSLIRTLSNAQWYGLLPEFYHYSEILGLGKMVAGEDATRRDALLTDAFLSFITDIQFGRLRSVSNYTSFSDLVHVLAHNDLKNTIESNEPDYISYRLLKSELQLLIDSIKKDQPEQWTENGVIDSGRLVRSMRCLQVNLERWRNESEDKQAQVIFINIPSFLLQVYYQDTILFESNVIVGTPATPTPPLSSTIECVVTYPYWNVPRRISVEELLPQIQKDSSFLTRNHFDVLNRKGRVVNKDSIHWNELNPQFFPYSLRQREGAENSLGLVKFVFDNPFAVYLHDTNAKKLFKRNDRSLSHGCIRVERAIDLAHYLVTGSISEESPELTRYMNRKERHVISIKDTPIHLRYFTAEVKNGRLYYYKDIYRLDEELYARFILRQTD